jgi:hypothetical protein
MLWVMVHNPFHCVRPKGKLTQCQIVPEQAVSARSSLIFEFVFAANLVMLGHKQRKSEAVIRLLGLFVLRDHIDEIE